MQTRRDFLKTLGIAGGGLILDISLSGCATPFPHAQPQDFEPNAWLQITPKNDIIFYLSTVEMGQGTMTGMTTLIGEELNTEPRLIQVKTAGVHPDFVNPVYGLQLTGGSTSTRNNYDQLRTAAAQAREMLRSAASLQLQANLDLIEARDGHIIYHNTRIPFGQFVHDASQLSKPDVTLKPEKHFRFIGKNSVRLDAAMKARGTGKFGIDTQLPNLHIAVLKRCPVNGGKVKSWQMNGADTMPKVKKVVEIPTGIAVVAQTYWHAEQALKMITVEWDLPALANHSSADIARQFAHLADTESGRSAISKGEGRDLIDEARQRISATYTAPYLAHATMEPMNCTVRLSDDLCEIWAPTQAPDVCTSMAELTTGLSRSKIKVHTTLIGGGFGRRLSVDYVVEATQIAKASGLTVKLVFSREDDVRHDYFRPAVHTDMEGGLNETGQIIGWYQKNVSPNIMPYAFKQFATAVLPGWLPDFMVKGTAGMGPLVYGKMLQDPSSTEGAIDPGYDFDNMEMRHVQADPGLRTGFWRSVGHSYNAFMVESFMDELAHAAKADPLQFRLDHLRHNPRMANTLRNVAAYGNWGKPSVAGASQGIAVHPSFGSWVAQIVEASIIDGAIRVHRVTVAVDCGRIVNPDIVKAQMEGAVIFGLTAALKGEITLKDGVVEQSNFDTYPLLRITEVPPVDVHLIDSEEAPGGVGEPGVPPVAPALANAVFAATGKRLRQLPLRLT